MISNTDATKTYRVRISSDSKAMRPPAPTYLRRKLFVLTKIKVHM